MIHKGNSQRQNDRQKQTDGQTEKYCSEIERQSYKDSLNRLKLYRQRQMSVQTETFIRQTDRLTVK